MSQNGSSRFRNLLAETEWLLTSGAPFVNPEKEDALYNVWAKKRREHFKRWGNLPTTHAENRRLETLKDKYRGERIFILGSGPSLNDTDLSKLEKRDRQIEWLVQRLKRCVRYDGAPE